MPELKNTFTGGKMNKDLDERLVKNGEYRHAVNIQVRTTDSSSDGTGAAGTVQNIKGNESIGSTFFDTAWQGGAGGLANPDHPAVCVGSVADEKNDKAYFLFSSPWISYDFTGPNTGTERNYVDTILEVDVVNNETRYVIVDKWAITNSVNGVLSTFDDSTYPSAGWTTLKVQDGSKYRPGMSIQIWAINGDTLFDKKPIIKAVDGNDLLLYELQTTFINPSSAYWMSFTSPRVLEFGDRNGPRYVNSINILDDFLMWTDGKSEPRKIHVPRCIAGTNALGANNGITHSKLFINNINSDGYVDANLTQNLLDNGGTSNGSGIDSYLKKEHTTVIKKAPKTAPTLEMKEVDRLGQVEVNEYNGALLTEGSDTLSVNSIITLNDSQFANTNFRPNDVLVFTYTGGSGDGARVRGVFLGYVNDEGEEVDEITNIIKVNIISVPSDVTLQDLQVWSIQLEKRKPIYELKMGRFGYRYKYTDGEYSSFSPWSELAFLPGDFDYVISKAYNVGMVNHAREMIIKDFAPYGMPLDVDEIDILYKSTTSTNVFIVKTVKKGRSPEWVLHTPNGVDSTEIETGKLSLTSEMIHRILPSSQTLRSWDNVPRKALTQEVVGNRLVFANYVQGYDLKSEINLKQNILSSPIEIDEFNQPPNKSIKSMRDYKVGMVFGDKYGRETPVIPAGYTYDSTGQYNEEEFNSETGDLIVEKQLAANKNSIVVQQEWDNPSAMQSIDYVKYFIKETSNEYYNLIMDRWYDSGDGTIWLSFNSADRNKVDEETYLLLKNKHGGQEPVLEKARYKVIAIENEAPTYIKTTNYTLGTLGEVFPGVQVGNASTGVTGLGFGVTEDTSISLDIFDTGVTPQTGVPQGLMTGNEVQFGAAFWAAAGFELAGYPAGTPASATGYGKLLDGKVYMRVVGINWVYDSGTGISTETYRKNSDWTLITNTRAVGTEGVKITWADKLYQSADMYTWWTTSGDVDSNNAPLDIQNLVYSIEIKEAQVVNKPEFDGKFFVKIEKDSVLQTGLMTLGSNTTWQNDGIFNLSYISSTTENQADYGPHSSDVAEFGCIDNDSCLGTWFKGMFDSDHSYYNPSSGNWVTAADVPDYYFDNGSRPHSGNGTLGNLTIGTYQTSWDSVFGGNVLGFQCLKGIPTYATGWYNEPNGGSQGFNTHTFGYGLGTSIGSSVNGGDYTQNWFYGNQEPWNGYDTVGVNDMDGPVEFTYGNGVVDHSINPSSWKNRDMDSDEICVLANTGLFASCTWTANFHTKNFWQDYVATELGPATGIETSSHNNAFIDGARARRIDSTITSGENPNFYTPPSLFPGGAGSINGVQTMGGMTISTILADVGQGDSGSGVLDKLVNGNYFKIGSDPHIYVITSVNGNDSEGWGGSVYGTNYSNGGKKPLATTGYEGYEPEWLFWTWGDYDAYPDDDGAKGYSPPLIYENCKECTKSSDSNPYPWDYWSSQFYGDYSAIFLGTPSSWWAQSDEVSGAIYTSFYTDNYHWEFDDPPNGGCRRRTRQITFRRINQATGELATVYDDDLGESVEVGFDVQSYDPRGHMRHDGSEVVSIQFMKPVPVYFNDDSPKNELGACWETEPKEDSDIDIYYEASNALPLKLTEENMFNFIPVGSKVQSISTSTGGETLKSPGPFLSDIKVANLFFAPQNEEVIIAITAKNTGSSLDRELVRGPYDIEGSNDTGSNGPIYIEAENASNNIQGDILEFTHPDGTVTRAKVNSYYSLQNNSAPFNNTFNELTTEEETYQLALTSGPKAFGKTSSVWPTGYYGISVDVWQERVELPWFNCYAFGNGVESDRVRDDFNAPQIDNGVKVSTTFSGYREENIGSGLIYSGIYNSTSQVNDLNEFNMSEKITKELNPSYGKIQRLKTRNTDMVVFTEDKVLRMLANKDALFNADGNQQLTASDRVLGQAIPYAGEFGISRNPESLAWDQYRMYFTDKQRGAVLRLSKDGLTPISNVGMKSWFRENIRRTDRLIGSFDGVNGEYNLSLRYNKNESLNDTTVSFNENSKGWVSFKSFVQDTGVFVSGKYITTKWHTIWQHYSDNVDRNFFYGKSPAVDSKIVLLFNDDPNTIKSFKSFNYDGSQARVRSFTGQSVIGYTGDVIWGQDETLGGMPNINNITGSLTNFVNVTDNEYYNLVNKDGWYTSSVITNSEQGTVLEYKNKEDKYFGQISGLQLDYNLGTHMNIQTDQFSVQGIGVASNVLYIQDNDETTDDCIPPCPPEEGLQCVNGECVEVFQIIEGCTDPLASNYNELATVDDGSCTYIVSGCMDPIAPNYDSFATQTFDTATGGLGQEWSSTCQPFCIDCNPYALGCMDNLAINFNPTATRDGYCLFEGQVVPCPGYLVTGVDQPGYNADAWDNTEGGAANIGLYDEFVYQMGYSCFYEGSCPEGEVWNQECNDGIGCCEEGIVGCCLNTFEEFNPAATICDDSMCLTIEILVPGCLDETACNYGNVPNANINATAGPYECEWTSCYGCMEITACNYDSTATQECFGPLIEDEDSPGYGMNTCCFWDCENSDYIPGCLNIAYEEYCGPDNDNWSTVGGWGASQGMDSPCNIECWEGGPCGEYGYPVWEDGIEGGTMLGWATGQLGPCTNLIDGETICEETTADWVDFLPGYTLEVVNTGAAGACQYQIYACNDSSAANYVGDNWADNLMPNTTIINDESLCTYLFGCTNADAFNYDVNAVMDDGSCRPPIAGCMDINAVNYSPFHTYDPEVETNNDYTDYGRGPWSWTYGGSCVYWVYGCMDPTAQNYNENANTQLTWEQVDVYAPDQWWWKTSNILGYVDDNEYNLETGDGTDMPPPGDSWNDYSGGYYTTSGGYLPNQTNAQSILDLKFAPGKRWLWSMEAANSATPPYSSFFTLQCDGCDCQAYGEGDAFINVRLHEDDMNLEVPAEYDDGQG